MKNYREKNVCKAESISRGVTYLSRLSPRTSPCFIVICVLFASLTVQHNLWGFELLLWKEVKRNEEEQGKITGRHQLSNSKLVYLWLWLQLSLLLRPATVRTSVHTCFLRIREGHPICHRQCDHPPSA